MSTKPAKLKTPGGVEDTISVDMGRVSNWEQCGDMSYVIIARSINFCFNLYRLPAKMSMFRGTQ